MASAQLPQIQQPIAEQSNLHQLPPPLPPRLNRPPRGQYRPLPPTPPPIIESADENDTVHASTIGRRVCRYLMNCSHSIASLMLSSRQNSSGPNDVGNELAIIDEHGPGCQCYSSAITAAAALKIKQNILRNMNEIKLKTWYFGPLTTAESELILSGRPVGTFLLRDSSVSSACGANLLSLSLHMDGSIVHTRIANINGRFCFSWLPSMFHSSPSLVEFIESSIEFSTRRGFIFYSMLPLPQQQVRLSLRHPLSRRSVVASLKHLSRFEILTSFGDKHDRSKAVQSLPLPINLKSYLLEKQIFIEDLDEFVLRRPTVASTDVQN